MSLPPWKILDGLYHDVDSRCCYRSHKEKRSALPAVAELAGHHVHMGKPIMHRLCAALLLICPFPVSLFCTFTINCNITTESADYGKYLAFLGRYTFSMTFGHFFPGVILI